MSDARRSLDDRIRRLAPPRVGPFRADAYRSRLHEVRAAAWLGIALGVAFSVCFVTGVISHLIQNPLPWFSWPARPAWLYRVTQGVHVATGIAAIPLLLAKLWVVAPLFWTWPPFRGVAHVAERLSLVPLVGGALFQLFTGIGSINGFRPWGFSFPAAHYAGAWIAIGGLVIHVGAKLHIAARALTRSSETGTHLPAGAPVAADPLEAAGAPAAADGPRPASPVGGLSRRGFLWTVTASAGAVTLATVGQTVQPLRRLAVLAPRDPAVGPQGVPVNKTARSARVAEAATDPAYRLAVEGRVGRRLSLSLDDLRSLPQREADLPISCVDGWSASGTWRGIAVLDLLRAAGADDAGSVEVVSLQAPGTAFRTSTLDRGYLLDPDTLLALELNGEPLALDHGFPIRLIAPNRPGVLQTKWLTRVVVS